MIRLNKAALLAYTKLRTHKIRTWLAVIISGLLFAGLVGALIVWQGTSNSLATFSKEGFNSRYIVSTGVVESSTPNEGFTDPGVLANAKAIYEQTIINKKAAAKRLGIAYDPSTEASPITHLAAAFGNPASDILNYASPSAQQALAQYGKILHFPALDDFKSIAAPYKLKAVYGSSYGGISDGSLTTMQNDTESFVTDPKMTGSNQQQNDPLKSSQIERVDPVLTQPFLLTNVSSDTTSIPIIVQYSKAEKLLGMKALPASASTEQRLAQIRQLYVKAATITISACYRNSISGQQIQSAISQAQDIAAHTGDKTYQKPQLIYGLPEAHSCGAAPIISDTRTQDEKTMQSKQDQFTREFGGVTEPVQMKLTFRVVGLTPDSTLSTPTTSGGLLQSVVGSSLGDVIAIPSDQLDNLTNASMIKQLLFSQDTSLTGWSPNLYYAEFNSAEDARRFIADKSCTTRPDGRCTTPERPFSLVPFGSNSIALQDAQKKVVQIILVAAAIVSVIALIIMMVTIGRMIVDSRRETAVFRAIGAKRIDIAAIYTIYTLWLSAYVALFALVMGVIAAYVFDHYFWQTTTLEARLLYGAADSSRQFHFFAWTPLITLVVVLVIVCGLLAMLLPVLRNVRRSPIRDMREE